jgi:hypothetical protein
MHYYEFEIDLYKISVHFIIGGHVVEEVRTVFERINDATIYIPRFEVGEVV